MCIWAFDILNGRPTNMIRKITIINQYLDYYLTVCKIIFYIYVEM